MISFVPSSFLIESCLTMLSFLAHYPLNLDRSETKCGTHSANPVAIIVGFRPRRGAPKLLNAFPFFQTDLLGYVAQDPRRPTQPDLIPVPIA